MVTNKLGREYRNDINGLRAWAVLAVIFYHFHVPGFSGGFIGVDVFFVISGFLMTQIIIGKLDSKPGSPGFSLAGFYLARGRRIIPALLGLCAALLFLGWFFLPAADYRLLGTHVVSAVAFFSNIQFWREGGYFDVASHEKWLLHTWSLSVEWQFYLILPLMLMAMWKLSPGRRSATVLIVVACLASLGLSLGLSSSQPGAAFYLLPARAWEMLAGGIVFLLAPLVTRRVTGAPTSVRVLEAAGFVSISLSIFLFSSKTVWPGYGALVPVVGAMLVLLAAREQSLYTGSRIAQWLGTRSYSLYLWHWPLVVVLVYLDVQQDRGAIAGGLALTLILGELSYRFVESMARIHLQHWTFGRIATLLASACLLVAVPAVFVRLHDGIRGRLAPNIEAAFDEMDDKNPRITECMVLGPKPVPNCTYGGPDLGAIVVGDSHAASIMRTVEKTLPDKRLHVLDWSMTSCPTMRGVHIIEGGDSPNCGAVVNAMLLKQSAFPKNVPLIIMNRTSMYAYGYNAANQENRVGPQVYFDQPVATPTAAFLGQFRSSIIETACEFAKARPVYLVRPIPELKLNVPKTMGRALQLGNNAEVSISIDEYRQRHALVIEAQDAANKRCGVHILDPVPVLCPQGRCLGAMNGLPMYYDDNHLSEHGARMLAPMFAEIFARQGIEAAPAGGL